MAQGNLVLELLEHSKVTLEDVADAIEAFEHDLSTHHGIEMKTCQFCGKSYVVQPGDKPVVEEQGRRQVCYRMDCRRELRARGLNWGGHHLYRSEGEPRLHESRYGPHERFGRQH